MTIQQLTDYEIEVLRAEAGAAGDWAMVDICDAALDGDIAAQEECARVMEESD